MYHRYRSIVTLLVAVTFVAGVVPGALGVPSSSTTDDSPTVDLDTARDRAVELEGQIEELKGALEHCEEEARETVSESSGASTLPARDRFFWFVTIDHGLWMIQAAIDWLEETIKRIRSKDYTSGETGAVLPPPRRTR